jgi:hypothetical protein
MLEDGHSEAARRGLPLPGRSDPPRSGDCERLLAAQAEIEPQIAAPNFCEPNLAPGPVWPIRVRMEERRMEVESSVEQPHGADRDRQRQPRARTLRQPRSVSVTSNARIWTAIRGTTTGLCPGPRQGVKPPGTPAPFPCSTTLRNGPRRQGFAPPRNPGAPLTAAGRSSNTLRSGKGGSRTSGSAVASRWSALELSRQLRKIFSVGRQVGP